MTLSIGAYTDAGRRGPPNEDTLFVHSPADPVALAVVADGMGGHNAGEVASKAAVATVEEVVFAGGPPSIDGAAARLQAAVAAANARIRQLALENPDTTGMGCTIVLALVIENLYWVGHVGDSRAYLVSPAAIQQITEDHTWVNARVHEGLLTVGQAARHPRRHVLEQALGIGDSAHLALRPAASVRPDERLLLCSDGVHDVLEPETIWAIVIEHDATSAARALVERAIQANSHDNVSAIVLHWEAALMPDPMDFIDTQPEMTT